MTVLAGTRLAEFETGAAASSMNQRTPLTGGDGSLWFRMPEYSAYFNDSWNVTPRLTVNLGIRYDVGAPRLQRRTTTGACLLDSLTRIIR